ncbi:MAG TPA: hypothetical protein VHM64_01275, partial [Candidatus Binatia bacterium]|nr:hypothetical protein [Candidatus Binatia bacterium]
NAKIKAGNLSDEEVEKLRAAAKTATAQATAPAASDDAKIGRYLTVPTIKQKVNARKFHMPTPLGTVR